ncbi:MAG: hypothetical protein ACFB0B_23115, partial [Thermonemataceae bacterium]
MRLIKSLLVLVCTFVFVSAKAQNLCVTKLKEAQTSYDQGRINEVPELLRGCLEDGFEKNDRIAAYKLLTLTHLYLNENDKAKETMRRFLQLNPEYEINTAIDPPEFINLYNSFRTKPIFLFGVKAGINRVAINETAYYTVDNINTNERNYSPAVGFQAGISFDIPLRGNFLLNPELYYRSKQYTYQSLLLD